MGIQRDFGYVDADEWTEDWSTSWVAFADILGFANACQSRATVTNLIVRFHHALHSLESVATTARQFRFTDAAFIVAPHLHELLAVCTALQHEIMHINAQRMKGSFLDNHLLKVRITISRGDVLTIGEDSTGPKNLGVDAGSLLAGEGIVRAHAIEKSATCLEVAVDNRVLDDEALRNSTAQIRLRGEQPYRDRILDHWRLSTSLLDHDGVRMFPWFLFRKPSSDIDDLVVLPKQEIRAQLRHVSTVTAGMRRGFLKARHPSAVGAHIASLDRMLCTALDVMDGVDEPRSFSQAALRQRLGLRPE